MRIVIIDDDRLIGMSLKMIIEADPEMQIAAIGTDGSQALDLYLQHRPDVLLMDIRMPDVDGLEAGKQVIAHDQEARILYLTTFADDEYIVKALRMGARGYILKQHFESLLPALHAIAAGQSVFGDDIISKIPVLMDSESSPVWDNYDLRDREQEIIRLVADGQNNKEIAKTLFIGEGTVRNSISIILEKLQLRDRTQLAIWYYKNQHQRI
jgi:DNA-binding NarL/FixJ family response regulator